jgi:hypothetical protein
MKQSGILVPSFLFILFRQWKDVLYFVAWKRRTGRKRSCIRAGDIWILEQQQLVTPPQPRMELDSDV